jgi:small-conductance mechanosensitive channel
VIYYGKRFNIPRHAILVSRNVTRIAILAVAVLVILDIWGAPTTPLLLLIAVAVLVAMLAFRDAAPDLFASFQLAATQEIKVGDYIKLESNDEGYVVNISWNNTLLKSLDGSSVRIPNSQLIRRKVINYGRPLKKAKEPFHFDTRTHLAELTGLKARNLRELVDILKNAPDAMVYYHTHHFLEERQYLVPELSNDFAVWTKEALGNEVLSERLAGINAFEFTTLGALKDRLVTILEEFISHNPDQREAVAGREFYFMKSVSIILPTRYVAHDLREFVEALHKISLSSLYFHIYESRLRLGRASNDFSFWMDRSMEDSELSKEIATIDPYTYTLEGLRSLLIQVIEKRIK